MMLASLGEPRAVDSRQALTPSEQLEEDERFLDQALLVIESRGSDGLVAAVGEPFYYPRDMRALEVLESRGLARLEIATLVDALGMRRRGTYFITDAGKQRCAVLKQERDIARENQ
jgi:hypothetical protein